MYQRSLNSGFKRIEFCSRLKIFEENVKSNHEKLKKDFMLVLSKKDKEQSGFLAQNEQANNKLLIFKGQEEQLLNKLSQKEKLIAQLEQELQELKKNKKTNIHMDGGISNSSTKHLEMRVGYPPFYTQILLHPQNKKLTACRIEFFCNHSGFFGQERGRISNCQISSA